MIGYFFKKTWQNIRHSFWHNIICLVATTLSLSIFGFFLLLIFNLSIFLKTWQGNIPIIVFFKNEKAALEAKSQLEKRKELKKVEYVSSEQALKRLEKWLKGKFSLLEGLKENPLFPSLEITFSPFYQTPSFLENFKKNIKNFPGVKEVACPSYVFSLLVTTWRFFKILIFLASIFLSISTIFIISTLIRFNFQQRREEIEIMRLLGANEWFIKCPFYLEGLIQGFFASVISLFILRIGVSWYNLKIAMFQNGFNFSFFDLQRILGFIGCGFILGGFGSFLSLYKS